MKLGRVSTNFHPAGFGFIFESFEMSYYDVRALAASGINLFYKSPAEFWETSVFNPNRIKQDETAAMLSGRVDHKMVFECDTFNDEFVIGPKLVRSSAGAKEYWDFAKEHPGRTIITQEMFDKAKHMRDALYNNSAARDILSEGVAEEAIFWDDVLPCKAKPDKYRKGLVIDYKTSRSAHPDEFKKSIVNFGYHRQASWYMRAIEKKYNEVPKGFVFIVQERERPEAIGIYLINAEAIAIGEAENDRAMHEIADRLERNDWQPYPAEVVEISLPGWYSNKFSFGG